MQHNSKTTVIETTENTTLHSVELSWLPERKARVAIPYALEDQVAQSIDELHFSFDKLRYQDKHYLVTVISKYRMKFLMQTLAEHDIDYDCITVDWYALSPQELLVSGSTLLVHQTDFKGSLAEDLAKNYMSMHPFNPPLVFQDNQIEVDANIPVREEHSYVWIAKRILLSQPINLCQGDMQHGNEQDWIKKGYYAAGILACVWLIALILVQALFIHSLNDKTEKLDKEIAVIYHQFFPDAKQVISPKFRIQQLLKDNGANKSVRFWFLLNQLAKGIKENPLTIEQLRFQNQTLGVTLVSTDFASLEKLKNRLSVFKLNVKQTQASTRAQQVVATLELT